VVCGGEGRCLAERAHLALAHQIVECAQGFFARRFGIGDMRLIPIDIVGLQMRQAFLASMAAGASARGGNSLGL
jgi:hypothetical protein